MLKPIGLTYAISIVKAFFFFFFFFFLILSKKIYFYFLWIIDVLLKILWTYIYVKMVFITKTRLFKYIENFTSKNWKFSDKKTLIFFLFLLKT